MKTFDRNIAFNKVGKICVNTNLAQPATLFFLNTINLPIGYIILYVIFGLLTNNTNNHTVTFSSIIIINQLA